MSSELPAAVLSRDSSSSASPSTPPALSPASLYLSTSELQFSQPIQPLQLHSAAELEAEFYGIISICANVITHDWTARIAALHKLAGIIAGKNSHYESFFGLLKLCRPSIEVQVNELRSAVCKEACCLLQYLACQLENSFSNEADYYLPSLIKLAGISVQVISNSAYLAAKALIHNVSLNRCVPKLIDLTQSNSPAIRARAMEYFYLWLLQAGNNQNSMKFYQSTVIELIRAKINDKAELVRAFARRSVAVVTQIYGEVEGKKILESLDDRTKKLIEEERVNSSLSGPIVVLNRPKTSHRRSISGQFSLKTAQDRETSQPNSNSRANSGPIMVESSAEKELFNTPGLSRAKSLLTMKTTPSTGTSTGTVWAQNQGKIDQAPAIKPIIAHGSTSGPNVSSSALLRPLRVLPNTLPSCTTLGVQPPTGKFSNSMVNSQSNQPIRAQPLASLFARSISDPSTAQSSLLGPSLASSQSLFSGARRILAAPTVNSTVPATNKASQVSLLASKPLRTPSTAGKPNFSSNLAQGEAIFIENFDSSADERPEASVSAPKIKENRRSYHNFTPSSENPVEKPQNRRSSSVFGGFEGQNKENLVQRNSRPKQDATHKKRASFGSTVSSQAFRTAF
jgi:hypothetical protein